MCSGTISVALAGASGATGASGASGASGTSGAAGSLNTLQIPVLVLVSTTPQLNISFPLGFGVFEIEQCFTTTGLSGASGATGATGTTAGGQCPTIERQISITSTDNSSLLNFFAVAANSGSNPWLFVAPNTGDTPSTVTVLIDPTSLAAGIYTGTITISPGVPTAAGATGASGTSGASGATGTAGSLPVPFSIPVTLTVTNGPSGTSGAAGASGGMGGLPFIRQR
jgi:hypothetical protein